MNSVLPFSFRGAGARELLTMALYRAYHLWKHATGPAENASLHAMLTELNRYAAWAIPMLEYREILDKCMDVVDGKTK